MNIGEGISGALFSDENRRFRYALWRIWEPRDSSYLLFIGLNPSTANDIKDDPTITRLCSFAKSWGFAGLFAGNLFSLVTPNPADLWLLSPPEHPLDIPNNDAIKRMRELCTKVLVGWGNNGRFSGTRPAEVLAILGEPVYCLKTTQSGEPGHPLYIRSTSELEPYIRSK